jgi:hypothetical protein
LHWQELDRLPPFTPSASGASPVRVKVGPIGLATAPGQHPQPAKQEVGHLLASVGL